jgi:hypothetical protein
VNVVVRWNFGLSSTIESPNQLTITKQERSMSKLVKLALILAVAAVAMAAKQLTVPGTDRAATALTPAASIAPELLMRGTTKPQGRSSTIATAPSPALGKSRSRRAGGPSR